jgi:hypothetical protein
VANQPPVRFDPVMRPRDLARHVIKGLDPDMAGIQAQDPGELPGGHPAELGNDHLQQETPARL